MALLSSKALLKYLGFHSLITTTQILGDSHLMVHNHWIISRPCMNTRSCRRCIITTRALTTRCMILAHKRDSEEVHLRRTLYFVSQLENDSPGAELIDPACRRPVGRAGKPYGHSRQGFSRPRAWKSYFSDGFPYPTSAKIVN